MWFSVRSLGLGATGSTTGNLKNIWTSSVFRIWSYLPGPLKIWQENSHEAAHETCHCGGMIASQPPLLLLLWITWASGIALKHPSPATWKHSAWHWISVSCSECVNGNILQTQRQSLWNKLIAFVSTGPRVSLKKTQKSNAGWCINHAERSGRG